MSSTAKPWEHAKSGEGSATDPLAARFVESLSYDRRLYKHDIAGSVAHARMLHKVGLLTAEELAAIERGLREIGAEIDAAGPDYGAAWPGWKLELEDVHMCIEAALIEKIGDPGRKLHTGRSRNDQVALDLTLWIEHAERKTIEALGTLQAAFVAAAERDGRSPMPSFTHLQRAQPIVWGAELLAWAQVFQMAEERFGLFDGAFWVSPLGSGAIAGSALPLDRHAVSAIFAEGDYGYYGLDPSPNSIVSTAGRDKAVDFVYALAMTAMWLSRWAEQWVLYCTTEFGFITLDGRYTTGSSMMPQKRNPDMLELIRGRCGNVYGHLVALLTICKGLPIGYNRDLQEDKRHVFAAYDVVNDCLEMAARIVGTTRFNAEKIAAGLDRGFLDATSLAEYLVTRGVPFRTAHQIVGALVRACEGQGFYKLGQLSLERVREAVAAAGQKPDAIDAGVFDWLGPEKVVERYQTYGNAGVKGFEEQLKTWKEGRSAKDEVRGAK